MADFSVNTERNAVEKNTIYKFGRPIFILGTAKRSGTNYLKNMICLHPDCYSPGPIWEDFLLLESNYLSRYVDCTFSRWNPEWDVDSFLDGKLSLSESIGNGILEYLHQQFYSKAAMKNKISNSINTSSKKLRLITKTPTLENVEKIFEFFPDALLIVITRDGRAVSESASKSFNKPFNIAIQEWKEEAITLKRFVNSVNFKKEQCRVVKFEDVLADYRDELTKIFQFIALDVNKYEFAKVDKAPVIGSSELANKGAVHWQGVQKKSGFDPTKRWSKWSPWMHARFNWVAGTSQVELGYSIEEQSVFFIVPNIVLDCFWVLTWKIWKLLRKFKYRLVR